jgi:hypothetical protein
MEGFFTLAPESVKKLEVEYTTPPGTVKDDYKLLIQKQPGTRTVEHTFRFGGDGLEETFEIKTDRELVFPR